MKKILILISFILLTACNASQIAINNDLIPNLAITGEINYENEATITMVGDVLIHDRLLEYANKQDGSYDFTDFFKNVQSEIQASDLALVNQESLVAGKEFGLSGYPMFNGPYELAEADFKAGFDVICQANNHALDRSTSGLKKNIANFEGLGLDVVGIYDQESDNRILVKEVNNIDIAILNYTYGSNGLVAEHDYLLNYIDEDLIKNDVLEAKKQADFVIVVLHWGDEYSLTPNSYQKNLAKYLNELEVDLVLGSHPHVIQEVELIDNGNYQTLVYYSLGNFINATDGRGKVAKRMLGGLASITIKKDIISTKIIDYDFKGLVSHLDLDGLTTTYYLKDYSQDLALENDIRRQDSSFSLEYLNDLFNKVYSKKDVIKQ